MEVFGFYGRSGTGKSHKVSEVTSIYQIDAVIDDGILIMNKTKVAGKSAKNERNAITATKTAIFQDENHAKEVREYIKTADIKKLLVVGTSKKMVLMIARRLELPDIDHWITIDQVQTAKELEIAKARRSEGYHIIPISPVEIEKTFTGYWFKEFIIRLGKRSEKITVVKPQYYSKVLIHPQVIQRIVQHVTESFIELHSIKVNEQSVFISLSMEQGYTIHHLKQWQTKIVAILSDIVGKKYKIHIMWKNII